MNYQHYMPTKIILGQGCINQEADQLAKLGWHAFVLTGEHSARKNGALDDVLTALEAKAVTITHYDKITPNPTIEAVRSAAAVAREKQCDFVVAIGGGSVIDAAKAVAVLCYNKLTDDELFSNNSFDDVLPVAAIPTTAGTGSEVTPYAILTNQKLETKSNLKSQQLFPALAFLDATYTLGLPEPITVATLMDAMSHAVEGYLAKRSTPFGKLLALESLNLIGQGLTRLNGQTTLNLEQRQQLLWASCLAGMVIAQSGTTVLHAIGYCLTYYKGVAHGRANGMLLPAYLDYIAAQRSNEIKTILHALGLEDVTQLKTHVQTLLGREPLNLKEVEHYTAKALLATNLANTNPKPSGLDIKAILEKSFDVG